MELTSKNIEEYIRRFMDGETTNDEEQAIYRFFRNQRVPAHLKSYQAMFAWYEQGMPQEPAPRKYRFSLSVGRWSVGLVAMLVMGVGLSLFLSLESATTKSDEWACYEGSYVVINGKRNSNIDEIMPQILASLRLAEETEKRMQERLDEIKRLEEYADEKGKTIIND